MQVQSKTTKPKAKNLGGRPKGTTKLTPEIQDKIVAAIYAGNYLETAAAAAVSSAFAASCAEPAATRSTSSTESRESAARVTEACVTSVIAAAIWPVAPAIWPLESCSWPALTNTESASWRMVPTICASPARIAL